MGNCFGKTKKNRVSPSPVNEDAVVPKSRPDSALLFQVSTSPLEELAKQISEDQKPKVGRDGLAFTVGFSEGETVRIPSRLADRLNGVLTPEQEVGKVLYTKEEREVMAGLLKADFLEERREKARRDDMKAKVAQNKAVINLQTEFRTKSALDKETPSLAERRRKVKEMADKARATVAKKC